MKTTLICLLFLPALLAASSSGTAARKNTVTVTLKDLSIVMPSSIPAGTTVFKVANEGSTIHGLRLSGQYRVYDLAPGLQPGTSVVSEVFLGPGEYIAECPVANHAQMGMKRTLRVTQ